MDEDAVITEVRMSANDEIRRRVAQVRADLETDGEDWDSQDYDRAEGWCLGMSEALGLIEAAAGGQPQPGTVL